MDLYAKYKIDWRHKHNKWFKTFLLHKGLKQYWNTTCINYNDGNYYFNRFSETHTEDKCARLIQEFREYVNRKLQDYEELAPVYDNDVEKYISVLLLY